MALSTNGSCASDPNVWITNVVVTSVSNGTMNVSFVIGGGQDGVYYDVFANSVLSIPPGTNAWAWMGQGLHCVTYLLTNMPNTSAFLILGTPKDSDADGLTDAYELLVSLTNPLDWDTDGDGLSDGEEIGIYHTDPFNQDSNGDGIIDQAFRVTITRPRGIPNLP
jgi:hypothetical protein